MIRTLKKHKYSTISIAIMSLIVVMWWCVDAVLCSMVFKGEEIPIYIKFVVYFLLTIEIAHILLISYGGSDLESFFLGWLFMTLVCTVIMAPNLPSSSDAPIVMVKMGFVAFGLMLVNHFIAYALRGVVWMIIRISRRVVDLFAKNSS